MRFSPPLGCPTAKGPGYPQEGWGSQAGAQRSGTLRCRVAGRTEHRAGRGLYLSKGTRPSPSPVIKEECAKESALEVTTLYGHLWVSTGHYVLSRLSQTSLLHNHTSCPLLRLQQHRLCCRNEAPDHQWLKESIFIYYSTVCAEAVQRQQAGSPVPRRQGTTSSLKGMTRKLHEALLVTPHWPELSHMVIASCKEAWEM